jgi:hypothetical protein
MKLTTNTFYVGIEILKSGIDGKFSKTIPPRYI